MPISVTEANDYIKTLVNNDRNLRNIDISGEISNCTYHRSGHLYFSLKDRTSVISCVMFKNYCEKLEGRVKDGDRVVVKGTVDVYVAGGRYQIMVSNITYEGEGDLFGEFLKLKAKLEEQGLFDGEYKKPIPRYIKTLGVVTASTGAAIQDIIDISKRRNPYIQIVLYPALVQGAGAVQSVINGINYLENYEVDTIIIGRGGGSIEDLWAFNSEELANVIFDCSIPIISAVGHETDFTIADYVADLRAPTPSAAAELANFEITEFNKQILEYKEKIHNILYNKIEMKRQKAEAYKYRVEAQNPLNKINEHRMRSMNCETKICALMKNRLEEERICCARCDEKIIVLMKDRLMESKYKLNVMVEKFRGLSPLDKLSQGYAYVASSDRKTLHSVEQARVGEEVNIHLIDGNVFARVENITAIDR